MIAGMDKVTEWTPGRSGETSACCGDDSPLRALREPSATRDMRLVVILRALGTVPLLGVPTCRLSEASSQPRHSGPAMGCWLQAGSETDKLIKWHSTDETIDSN